MDDNITERISQLLESKDGMDKIKQVAATLFNGDDPQVPNFETTTQNNTSGLSKEPDILNQFEQMQGMLKIFEIMKSQKKDPRVDLLAALKPHLSPARAKRVDKAVMFLKIASLLPVLKNEGVLDNFIF